MAIIAARIDGRLVHGQVANLWTTKLGATRIMVVDEAASKSDIDKRVADGDSGNGTLIGSGCRNCRKPYFEPQV